MGERKDECKNLQEAQVRRASSTRKSQHEVEGPISSDPIVWLLLRL